MTRRELVEILRAGDPVAAAQLLPAGRPRTVTWTRAHAPADWLRDDDHEGPVEEHRAAHAAGRPSEAVIAYGTAVAPEATAERILALAELDPAMLRAACPVPADGSPDSWGVQDLAVIAATRLAMPDVAWVRPSWPRLGAGLCQVAVAFGANDWVIPEADPSDPEALAGAVGCTAVAR